MTSLCDQGPWRVGSLTAATERAHDRAHRCAACLVAVRRHVSLASVGSWCSRCSTAQPTCDQRRWSPRRWRSRWLGRWSRHASNTIRSGGSCWPSGCVMTASLLGESYARYALITAPGSLPGGLYGTWLGWTYAPMWRSWRSFCRCTSQPAGCSRHAGDRWSGWGSASWSSRWLAMPCGPDPSRRCWALLRCPTRWCSCPRPGRCSSCSATWLGCAFSPGSLGPSPRWWCDFDVPAGSNASSSSGSPTPRPSPPCPSSPTSSLRASPGCCAR